MFIPRFESEHLVTILEPELKKLSEVRFVDLGCGSGVLGISLVKEFNGNGVAVDIDHRCLRAASQNLKYNGLKQESMEFVQGDMV